LVADVLAVSLALLAVHHSLGLCTSPGAVRQAVVAALTVLQRQQKSRNRSRHRW
jgi:hypothetical protein